jgi:integrase
MRGRVYRRCGCRDDNGRQLGMSCPQLATDSKHGTWGFAVDLPTADGRRRTMRRGGFPTKTAATKALADVTTRAAQGVHIDDRETVAAFLRRWLTVKSREAKPTTMRSYRAYVEGDLIPALGGVRLEELRAQHVERFFGGLLDVGRGQVTVRRIHATLRSALGYAVQTHRLQTNVAANIRLPNPRRPDVQPWSASELACFLSYVTGDSLGPLFEVIAACGLRRGEALALRWADVDLTNRILYVQQTLNDVNGHLVFTRPKTKASEASVPLTERAVGALLEQRLRQETLRAQWASAYEDGDLVFARENGAPLRPDYVTKRFAALAAEAGLRQVRLHDLRHGAASLMLSAGVPMAIVSKMLRHSSIGITVDTYHHLDPDTARAASDAIGQLLDAAARDHTATTSPATDPADATAGPSERTNPQAKRGAPSGTRTPNPLIKSQLLCQLS